MRSTIKDVSREAGVSIKTVSRVLNKQPRVSDDARRRVLAAVELLNFRPSAAARSLVGHRTFQIALACDNPSPFYVHEMQSGIRDRCQLDGVRMIAQPYDHKSDRLMDEIESLIDTTGIDGLILTPPASDRQDVLDLLERRGVPFVRISPAQDIGRSSSVFLDNRGAADTMTRHLLALGHRRIGFVSGHPSYTASPLRRAGFEAALAAAGCGIDPLLVRAGTYDFASGAAAGEALLALPDPPTAIFASNDEMAAGVLSIAHRRGLSMPRDLSVAGFGDDAVASFVWPPLTTIRQP
ncbi:MAG: LacI family DNA-binding transcriptional regulator, partial [Sphingobium sp.]